MPTTNRMVPAANKKPKKRSKIFIEDVPPGSGPRPLGSRQAKHRTCRVTLLAQIRRKPHHASRVVARFFVQTEAIRPRLRRRVGPQFAPARAPAIWAEK